VEIVDLVDVSFLTETIDQDNVAGTQVGNHDIGKRGAIRVSRCNIVGSVGLSSKTDGIREFTTFIVERRPRTCKHSLP